MAAVSMKKPSFWERSIWFQQRSIAQSLQDDDLKICKFKLIAPSADVKQKKNSPKKSVVFGDILHNYLSIRYILCNMKSSSCTKPFTEHICTD